MTWQDNLSIVIEDPKIPDNVRSALISILDLSNDVEMWKAIIRTGAWESTEHLRDDPKGSKKEGQIHPRPARQ